MDTIRRRYAIKIMGLAHSPKIVTDGLVLCLDAGDGKSYSGSGTTWTDRSGQDNNGTLTNDSNLILILEAI